MSTLAEIRNTTRNYIKIDPNGKIFDDTNLNALINRAYFQVQKDGGHRWRECYTSSNLSTTAGTATVAQPSDFIKADMLSYSGIKLSKTEKTNVRLTNPNNTQGTPYSYYIYGSTIGFDPVPNTTYTIVLDYFKRLPTMTASVGSSLPTDFDDAIALYATYLALKSINKMDVAQASMLDYQGILQTLLSSYVYDDTDTVLKYQRNNTGYVRSDVLVY